MLTYCLKCRKNKENKDVKMIKIKNGSKTIIKIWCMWQ